MNKDQFIEQRTELLARHRAELQQLVDGYLETQARFKLYEVVVPVEQYVTPTTGGLMDVSRRTKLLVKERHVLGSGDITYIVTPGDKPELRMFMKEGDIRGNS